MIGDAWQWADACFDGPYRPEPAATGPKATCEKQLLRGGTWGDTPVLIRAAYRNWAPPPKWPKDQEYRSGGVGFRLVREVGR
jgi:formylglycine-generating enzyme required for sulfatase activity